MRRLKLLLIGLFLIAVAQLVALLAMSLTVYQATDKGVLARATFIGDVKSLLVITRYVDRSLNWLYQGEAPAAPLPTYQLQIDRSDLALLEEELQKAEIFLTDDAKMWLSADFYAEGEHYPVKIRVRGDRFNHWAFGKKSWRVKFPKDQLFKGMRQLNLIIPEDRVWHAEVLSYERSKRFNLLAPPMQHVAVAINGQKPAVYLEVEHWTKEMLEKQGRPGDVNFYQPGGVLTSSFDGWDPIMEDIGYWDKFLESNLNESDTYEELDLLFDLFEEDAHLEPDFKAKVSHLFDLDKVISWYGISMLAGNRHIGGDNLRLFFDPSLGKFEALPWDFNMAAPRSLLSLPGNELWNNIFAVPEWRVKAQQWFWDYVSDDDQVVKDLILADDLRNLIERPAYRDPLKLQSNRQVKADLDKQDGLMRDNIISLQEQLKKSEVIIKQSLPIEGGAALVVDFTVRGPTAAEIKLPTDSDYEWVRSDEVDSLLLYPIQTEFDEGEDPVGTPHTEYRYFLYGPKLEAADLPLEIKIVNAVTGEDADIIRTLVIDSIPPDTI